MKTFTSELMKPATLNPASSGISVFIIPNAVIKPLPAIRQMHFISVDRICPTRHDKERKFYLSLCPNFGVHFSTRPYLVLHL